ncbi:hypothetical protein ACFL59_12930 [Planctomycetota bacterium]
MVFLLNITRGIYNAIAGSGNPNHVAVGVWLGLIAGLAPLGITEALTLLILFLLLITRAGFAVFLCTLGVVKPIMLAGGSRITEATGVLLLERIDALKPMWETVLNLPVVALFGLDRYEMLGGAMLGVLVGAALFFPIRKAVVTFRESIAPRLNNYRVVRWLRGFWLVRVLSYVFTGRR